MPAFLPMLLALQALSMFGLFVSFGSSLRFTIGQMTRSSPSKAWLAVGIGGAAITVIAVVAILTAVLSIAMPQMLHEIQSRRDQPLLSITFSASN